MNFLNDYGLIVIVRVILCFNYLMEFIFVFMVMIFNGNVILGVQLYLLDLNWVGFGRVIGIVVYIVNEFVEMGIKEFFI